MQVVKYMFQPHGDDRGQLVALEEFKDIPFRSKRVYYMYDTRTDVVRGHHAHKSLEQILICIHGSCKIRLDNGKEKIDFKVINVSAIKDINEYQLVRNRLFNMDFDDNNEYMVYDDAPEYFKYVFNKAIKDNNFEMLFNMFDIEEISLYSNYYEKGKVK